jgi:hypothetical protein
MIESNSSFGPHEFNYFPIGSGSEWFTKWIVVDPPSSGFKFHVSPHPSDAEIVARSVLPKLRELRVFHKVVRNLQKYLEQWQGDQKGKFITIYTNGPAQGQLVLDAIDPELCDLREFGGLKGGYPPTTRESGHQETEIRIGSSGLIFTRWFDEGSGD